MARRPSRPDDFGETERIAAIIATLVIVPIVLGLLGMAILVAIFDTAPRAAALIVLLPALAAGVIGAALRPVRNFVYSATFFLWPF